MYEGGWLNNKKHGEGRKTWPNGDVYEGGWLNDKKHGEGRKTWHDGDVYAGGWFDDKSMAKALDASGWPSRTAELE